MGGYACAALLGVCGVLLAPRLATNGELCIALTVAFGCAYARMGRWVVVLIIAVAAPALENAKVSITGVIDSVPQRRLDAVRFAFAVEQQSGGSLPRRIELSWYD